jgi:hypothetical protein
MLTGAGVPVRPARVAMSVSPTGMRDLAAFSASFAHSSALLALLSLILCRSYPQRQLLLLLPSPDPSFAAPFLVAPLLPILNHTQPFASLPPSHSPKGQGKKLAKMVARAEYHGSRWERASQRRRPVRFTARIGPEAGPKLIPFAPRSTPCTQMNGTVPFPSAPLDDDRLRHFWSAAPRHFCSASSTVRAVPFLLIPTLDADLNPLLRVADSVLCMLLPPIRVRVRLARQRSAAASDDCLEARK